MGCETPGTMVAAKYQRCTDQPMPMHICSCAISGSSRRSSLERGRVSITNRVVGDGTIPHSTTPCGITSLSGLNKLYDTIYVQASFGRSDTRLSVYYDFLRRLTWYEWLLMILSTARATHLLLSKRCQSHPGIAPCHS